MVNISHPEIPGIMPGLIFPTLARLIISTLKKFRDKIVNDFHCINGIFLPSPFLLCQTLVWGSIWFCGD